MSAPNEALAKERLELDLDALNDLDLGAPDATALNSIIRELKDERATIVARHSSHSSYSTHSTAAW
jgi:hypothetical protein